MTDRVQIHERIAERLLAFSVPVRDAAFDLLERLSESPTSWSRPAVMPFPSRFQMAQSHINRPDDNAVDRVTLLFKYHSDEQTLLILDVGFYTTIHE